MHMISKRPTLIDTVWASDNTALRNALLAIGGSLALWVSAKIQVPFYPVPMTMQTFVVLVIAMTFGWRLGAATISLYLLEGTFGIPVFSGTPERGIGVAYMVGPTGGYLLGYLVAAVTVGWLAERGWDRKATTTLLAMAIGSAIIYAFGVAWLGAVIGFDKPLLQLGVLPFLPGDAFKMALAAALLPLCWKGISKK